MAHSETFSPDITVVKNVYEDYSQYVLIMGGKYEMRWYRNKCNFCPNCGADMKGGAV